MTYPEILLNKKYSLLATVSPYEEEAGSIWPNDIVVVKIEPDIHWGTMVYFVNAENMQSNLDEFNGCPVELFHRQYVLNE